MLLVTLFAVVAGVVRIGQDTALAWRHGTSPLVDAYYFLVSMAGWPVVVALSTLTLLLASTEAALQRGDAMAARLFRAELLGAGLLLSALSLPLAWLLLPALAASDVSGLDIAAAAAAVAGAPALAVAMPAALLGSLLAAWLVATGRHVLSLLEALPPLVLVVALLYLPGTALFWGTAAGLVLQAGAMALALGAKGGLPWPRLGLSAPAWRGFMQGAAVLLVGQLLFTLVPLVDPFFAARQGDGVLAALSFANRLVLGVQGLAGLALQRACLPLLSRWMATSPWDARRAAFRWSLVAAGAGVAIGLGVAAFAQPLVALLYERGSFTAADRDQVTTLLRYGMLQMPPFLAGLVLVTALAASRDLAFLAFAAGAGLLAKVVLSALLVPVHGAQGLLMATALMYLITTLMVWAALKWRLQTRHKRNTV